MLLSRQLGMTKCESTGDHNNELELEMSLTILDHNIISQ